MARLSVVVATLAVAALLAGPTVVQASNGACIACTIVLGLLEQGAIHLEANGVTGEDFGINNKAHCQGDLACEAFLNTHGDNLSQLLASGAASESPDDTCRGLHLCKDSCTLYKKWPVVPPSPPPPPTPPHFPNNSYAGAAPTKVDDSVEHTIEAMTELAGNFVGVMHKLEEVLPDDNTDFFTTMNALAWGVMGRSKLADVSTRLGSWDPCGLNLTCIITRVFDKHLPLIDNDGDDFAPVATGDNGFRGADWRGRDCNDSDANVYPGRLDFDTADPSVDANCNGISGTDSTGTSYEDMLCKGTEQRGVVILGDSAAAHFHIPPEWLRARGWNLDHLVPAAEDELDWPQCGWAIGWNNETDCPESSMPMKSFYDRMLERNKCMHRDFQNIGVNGARVTSMAPRADGQGIIQGLKRDQTNDNPLLTFFALIGNDVCNGHNGTSHMTPPDQFYESVTASLTYLDGVLPKGSSVVIVALVDGRVLWDIMHNLTHPIGVPYADVYDYLGCSGMNPCWGWLNSNATMRNVTTKWAQSLNAVYSKIVATHTYDNFELIFHNPDWQAYINAYVAAGGIAHELIEPSDGFHPSQSGNMLLAMNMWDWIAKNKPEILGPINPNNDKITELFGDQGGYGPTEAPYGSDDE